MLFRRLVRGKHNGSEISGRWGWALCSGSGVTGGKESLAFDEEQVDKEHPNAINNSSEIQALESGSMSKSLHDCGISFRVYA